MTAPKVSIIWVNYNSEPILDVAKRSLEAIWNLQYPNSELVAVDNGSVDASLDWLKDRLQGGGEGQRLVKIPSNVGYAHAANFGFRHLSPDSKYIALVNNDFVPYPEGLSDMVERLEAESSLGATELAVLGPGGRRVTEAGFVMDEAMRFIPRYQGSAASEVRPGVTAFAGGTYCLVRRSCCDSLGRIFDPNLFLYWEDAILGLEIWNLGYKITCGEIAGGEHRGSQTTARAPISKAYHSARGLAYLLGVTNSRFADLVGFAYRRRLVPTSLHRAYEVARNQGFFAGTQLAKRANKVIDIYRAPVRMLRPAELLKFMLYPPSVFWSTFVPSFD